MHGGANITQSSSSHESEQVETLKEMFPDKNSEQIEQALRQTQFDLRGAVNKLLFGVAGVCF